MANRFIKGNKKDNILKCINNPEWKEIEGYDKKYFVNINGDIFNTRLGALLKPTDVNSYKAVYFIKNGIIKRFYVHRLIAIYFIPNPDNKPHINHIDSNPSNNNINNLEWCTASENTIHAIKVGRRVNGKNVFKTNEKIIDKLLTMINNGYTFKEIAKELNLSTSMISGIRNKRCKYWKDYVTKFENNLIKNNQVKYFFTVLRQHKHIKKD